MSKKKKDKTKSINNNKQIKKKAKLTPLFYYLFYWMD